MQHPEGAFEVGRGQATKVFRPKVFRPKATPFLLANVYLHSGQQPMVAEAAHKAFAWLASTQEDVMVVGDWNLEVEQWPLSSFHYEFRV